MISASRYYEPMAYIEQLDSGRWRGVYRLPDGKKKSVKGTFAGKREALRAANDAESGARSRDWGSASASKRTWGEWCEEWWPTRDIEDSTARRQLTQRIKHIDGRWADVPLEDFTRHDVRAWAVSLMKEKGLSRSSAQKLTLMLSASFTAAIDKGVVDMNPAARLKLGTIKSTHTRFLSPEEGVRLKAAMRNPVDQAVVSTFLGAGLRWGELNGLQAEYVDLRLKKIDVVKVWDSGSNRLKEYPKDRRQRPVPIPDWLVEVLEPLVAASETGFVFEKRGFKLNYGNWRNKIWLPAIEEAGLAPLRIHDLRHSYASFLASQGFSLLEIGQLLGHEDPSTTQIYAHLVDPSAERVRNSLPRI